MDFAPTSPRGHPVQKRFENFSFSVPRTKILDPILVLRALRESESLATCFGDMNHQALDGRIKSIEEHALDVAQQYLRYFSQEPLPEAISRKSFLVILDKQETPRLELLP